MYDSYWDKEMKQSRTKNVMAFGYVEDLISDEIPDPVAYYKEFVRRKNEERAAAFAQETRPRAFAAPVEYHLGQFLLHTLLEELNVKDVIGILSAQMRFQFQLYDMMAQLIFSRVICPCSKSKTVSSVFPHLYNSSPMSEDQVYDGLALSVNPTRNTLSSLTIVMSNTIQEISAMCFLTVRIIISRSICPGKINKKDPPRRTGTLQSSGRRSSLTRIWCRSPCRCIQETNLKNHIFERPLRK